MQRHAFTMKLKPGCAEAYKQRHDDIWPELTELLHEAGIRDYTIWLAEDNVTLFALMHLTDDHRLESLPDEPLMQRWWEHMADLMETHSDHAPVTGGLTPVFHQD